MISTTYKNHLFLAVFSLELLQHMSGWPSWTGRRPWPRGCRHQFQQPWTPTFRSAGNASW